ncbi:S-layer homology domain-containing protein [Butyricicoccus porcorum]
MQWAASEGVMSGINTGNLNPKGTLTRAEAAFFGSRDCIEGITKSMSYCAPSAGESGGRRCLCLRFVLS